MTDIFKVSPGSEKTLLVEIVVATAMGSVNNIINITKKIDFDCFIILISPQ